MSWLNQFRISLFVVIVFTAFSVWAEKVTVITEKGIQEIDFDYEEEKLKYEHLNLSYPVTNIVEEMYDEDNNQLLTNIEVLYLLRDVLNVVQSKKKFEIVSDIIRVYDENLDGWIDIEEAKKIEMFLY